MKLPFKSPPPLCDGAFRYFSVCFVITVAYLLCIITYALLAPELLPERELLCQMLENTVLAVFISMLMTLAIDRVIRESEKKK